MKQQRPKKKFLPRVSLGGIEIESLPLPVVYYPNHYGTFFCFSHKKFDYDSITMCLCSKVPVVNLFQLITCNKTINNLQIELKNYFPGIVIRNLVKWDGDLSLSVRFQEGICHKCNKVTPSLRYCNEIYGTKFVQYWGWYVNQTFFKLGIRFRLLPNKILYLSDVCPKELQDEIEEINLLIEMLPDNSKALKDYLVENVDFDKLDSQSLFWRKINSENPQFFTDVQSVVTRRQRTFLNKIENITRSEIGFKNIGEGWINETVLFHIVKQIFPNEEVLFHSRPSWLNGLEIDVYVPGRKLGFEYQGEQHYKAIDVWGGIEALKKLKKRDAQKVALCKENGIRLITIDYSESITEKYIVNLIDKQ